ncbi:MAG: flagellar hook-length control protein FliK [Planctomycetaceae bacterium]|nr:flagellar hook-length control protein FliK [Planctomycetaceae bacterium]
MTIANLLMSNLGQMTAKPAVTGGRTARAESQADQSHTLQGDLSQREPTGQPQTDDLPGDGRLDGAKGAGGSNAKSPPLRREAATRENAAALTPTPVAAALPETAFQTLLARIQGNAGLAGVASGEAAARPQVVAPQSAVAAPVLPPAVLPQDLSPAEMPALAIDLPAALPEQRLGRTPVAEVETAPVTPVAPAGPQVAKTQRPIAQETTADLPIDVKPPATALEAGLRVAPENGSATAPSAPPALQKQALPAQVAAPQEEKGPRPQETPKASPGRGTLRTRDLGVQAERQGASVEPTDKPATAPAAVEKLAESIAPRAAARLSDTAGVAVTQTVHPAAAAPAPVATIAATTSQQAAAVMAPPGQQVAAAVVEHRFSSQRVSVALDPPELGSIHLSLHARGSEIRGVVEVNNPATLDQLRQETPSLIDRLASTGLNVRQIELRLSGDAGSGSSAWQFSGGHNGWQQSASQQGGWASAQGGPVGVEQAPEPEVSAAAAARISVSDGSVNLWI